MAKTPQKWQMRVAGLALDPGRNDPVVILRDLDNRHQIPIWIGQVEAIAIATQLQGVKHPRPMTHDLLKNALEGLGCRIVRVEINDLRNNTFYARLVVTRGGEEVAIDSRPSDAIALALRTDAAIFTYDHVLQQARMDVPEQGSERAEGGLEEAPVRPEAVFQAMAPRSEEDWESYLSQLDPDAFGKVKQ